MTIEEFKKKTLKKPLPDSPGVYFFKKGREILYIGKATSLRSRVRSYFAKDLIKVRSMLIGDMVSLSSNISFEKTNSVLEALILEANLIKQYLPKYNTKEKDNKSFNFVIITNENFPKVVTMRGRNLELEKAADTIKIKYQFGPFMNGMALQQAQKIIRRIFPYRDTCTPLVGRPCFNAQLGLCPGVCAGTISKQEYANFIKHIVLFFQGKKRELRKVLKKEMNEYVKVLQFEKAHQIKKQLFAIDHIRDVSMMGDEYKTETAAINDVDQDDQSEVVKPFRIEAYDIAHTSGKDVVGVMTVIEDGIPKKADYKVFKIKGGFGNNDIASLKEVVERRLNHPEWRFPDVMLIDGGTGQYNGIEEVLHQKEIHINVDEEARSMKYEKSVYLMSLVKNEKHQPKAFLGQESIAKKHKKALLLANAEAHRFTLTFHRKLRSKSMFGK